MILDLEVSDSYVNHQIQILQILQICTFKKDQVYQANLTQPNLTQRRYREVVCYEI